MRISDWSSDVCSSDLRVAAAQMLLRDHDVDLIVSDDGLQHYRLARDLEICLIDGRRGLGNGALLPAGPLRETPARLAEVQLVVINGDGWTHAGALQMRLRPAPRRRLVADEQPTMATQIGRATWRERVCQYVYISVVGVSGQTKSIPN